MGRYLVAYRGAWADEYEWHFVALCAHLQNSQLLRDQWHFTTFTAVFDLLWDPGYPDPLVQNREFTL